MKYPLQTLTPYGRFRAFVYRTLRRPYLVAALLGYVLIGLLVAAYMSMAPSYTSDLELVLPGTGASSNVSLDDVGQVVSQTSAPFSMSGFNPRINYKQMLLSRAVLNRAAEIHGVSREKFGQPKVQLPEQTSILQIAVKAPSGVKAQGKAWALYEALQQELAHLRKDEGERRDQSIEQVLSQYRDRMQARKQAIIDFQMRAMLVSESQMDHLLSSLAEVRDKRLFAQSELAQVTRFVQEMSQELGVSPRHAGDALRLQSDPEYRGYLKELNTAVSGLSELRSYWGDNHPKVKAEKQRKRYALLALGERASGLLGNRVAEVNPVFNLEFNPKQADLFSRLVEKHASQESYQSLLLALSNREDYLQDKIKIASREVAELERLNREFDMAEAVFTSAAARLEAGKADVFASYPVVQMLTEPSLPVLQVSPNPLVAIVAVCFGFFMVTFGLIVVWQRKNIIHAVLKKA